MNEARGIVQAYLDEMGEAVMQGDFARYALRVCLPFHLETETGCINVTTETDLRAGFDTYVSLLRNNRVTDFIRLVTSADMMGRRMLSGHFVTHILSGGQRIAPPHLSQITLRLSGDGDDDGDGDGTLWQAVCITNGMQAAQWPIYAFPKSDPGRPS